MLLFQISRRSYYSLFRQWYIYNYIMQGNPHTPCSAILFYSNDIPAASHLEVVLGAHNIKEQEESQQRIQIRDYFYHPKYKEYLDAGDWRNLSVDIMLLKVRRGDVVALFFSVLSQF